MKRQVQGVWTSASWVAMGAVLISFAPILVKVASQDGVGPTAIAFWRTAFGGLLLLGWCRALGKSSMIPGPVRFWAVLAGFLFFLDLMAWHRSIVMAGAGMATILGNTQVVWASLLGFLMFRERLAARFVFMMAAAMVGIVLLVGVGSSVRFEGTYPAGIGLGLLTGLLYASFLLALTRARRLDPDVDPRALMAWIALSSACLFAVSNVLEGKTFVAQGVDGWMAMLGLGLLAQALGWYVISSRVNRLKTGLSGMLLLLQPVLATCWGAFWFREHLQPTQLIGAAIVLLAIYGASLRA